MNIALDADAIAAALPPELRGIDIRVFRTTSSTNDHAKRLILCGAAAGTAVLAEHQTAGRGRLGRRFYSPAGSGLYMSVVLRPRIDKADELQLVTVAAAVAVCRAIDALKPGAAPQIKWVNDIFIDGKKACGILAEAVSSGGGIDGVAAGIGVNCTTEAFPPELRDIACSVGGVSRNALAAEIIAELLALTGDLRAPELIGEYRRRSYTLGRRISFERGGETVYAVADSINDSGNLVVREPDGVLTVLRSGEATLI